PKKKCPLFWGKGCISLTPIVPYPCDWCNPWFSFSCVSWRLGVLARVPSPPPPLTPFSPVKHQSPSPTCPQPGLAFSTWCASLLLDYFLEKRYYSCVTEVKPGILSRFV